MAGGGRPDGLGPHQRVRGHLHEPAHEEDREQQAGRGARVADRRRAERGGGVAREVVEAQRGGQPLPRGGARHRDLLERQERTGLPGADRQVAHHRGGHDQPGLLGRQEDQGRDDDEAGLGDQRRTSSIALGRAADREGHGRAGEEREGHRHPDLSRVEAALGQVDREEHAEEAVAERARRLSGEDEAPVAVHARSAWQ
ncbi:MAG TPA: hypothetical protein VK746_09380 [Candidatus Eisenbacteria bacterium]|nr:hypothetical protein [Candidatus Eisenbacteria bacterium]